MIDIETGYVRYSSAGHPPAVICAKSCEVLATEAGVPLGTFARPYLEQSTRLEPGDVLVAYTDGITEARHAKKRLDLFGDARLLAQLDNGRNRDPQELVDGLMAAAMDFAGGRLSDDAAIIAVSLANGRSSS